MTKSTPTAVNGNPNSDFVLLSMPGMHDMTARISGILKANYGKEFPYHKMNLTTFNNGEHKPHSPETVRGQHAFLVVPLQLPDPNIQTVNMLAACDMLKRASVDDITIVAPFIPYQRQDRKDGPRTPITAKLMFDLIGTNVCVKHIITLDLHVEQAQGFFDRSLDNMHTRKMLAAAIQKDIAGEQCVVISPDIGSVKRAHKFAKEINNPPVRIYDKDRDEDGVSLLGSIGADVKDRVCLIFDDMVDTAGSLLQVCDDIKSMGAKRVIALMSHAILSKDAVSKCRASGIKMYVTDTIPRDREFIEDNADWLEYVSVDRDLARAIAEHSTPGGSISKYL